MKSIDSLFVVLIPIYTCLIQTYTTSLYQYHARILQTTILPRNATCRPPRLNSIPTPPLVNIMNAKRSIQHPAECVKAKVKMQHVKPLVLPTQHSVPISEPTRTRSGMRYMARRRQWRGIIHEVLQISTRYPFLTSICRIQVQRA